MNRFLFEAGERKLMVSVSMKDEICHILEIIPGIPKTGPYKFCLNSEIFAADLMCSSREPADDRTCSGNQFQQSLFYQSEAAEHL